MTFVQARWFHEDGNFPITRIVLHDAEFPEKLTGAEEVAQYFAHVERKASAHAVADADSRVDCVHDKDIAFHAPPNTGSLGLELVGYAKQTTADWLDDFGTRMLRDQAAPWVRVKAKMYGIPLRWLEVADLKANPKAKGITSHNNVSLAFGQSTHTDPGPNFPIEQFMLWVIGAPPLPTPPMKDDDAMTIWTLNYDKTVYVEVGDTLRPLTPLQDGELRQIVPALPVRAISGKNAFALLSEGLRLLDALPDIT